MSLYFLVFFLGMFLIDVPDWETPLPLDWPFTDGSVQRVAIGWGDWTPSSEGPHPGLDFSGNASDFLKNPLTTSGYIIAQYPIAEDYLTHYDTDEGSLVFAPNLPEVNNWGWQYDHIDYDVELWSDYVPGTEVATFQVFELIPNPDQCIWPHTHVYWGWVREEEGTWVPGLISPGIPGMYPMRGYANPFEYLPQDDLVNYDNVRFKKLLVDGSSSGIWFSPDGKELPSTFNLNGVTPAEFQNAIFGVVDFSVAAYSAYQDNPAYDSCGIYSIGHRLRWDNPYFDNAYDHVYYDNVFDKSANIFERSRSSYRTLVEMKGELPYDSDLGATPANTPEYQMVFLDENFVEVVEVDAITPTPSRPWFNSAYILTNCGNSSTGENGWDNLAVESSGLCDHFWASNEMCVGGWDTQLLRGDRGGNASNEQALISQHSLFPDGKYVIDVTAQSSGTAYLSSQYQNTRSKLFPSNNVEDLNSEPAPVIVDNYIPYVDSLIVYEISTSLPQTLDIIYTAGWEENTETGEAALRPNQVGYLSLTPSVSNLWIAVRYSEGMDVSVNDVWITAEMKGENTWDSGSSGRFRPEPTTIFWPDEIGTLDTSRLAGGVWYLYKYGGSLPTEYKGRLTLHFNASDYAGNKVDGNPETLCSPRNADGSWPNSQNYEEGPDASYTWGDCEWDAEVDAENETGYYRAMVGNTEVQRVDFSELDFTFQMFPINSFATLGYIPYSCGMYAWWESGVNSADRNFDVFFRRVRVVDGNGNVLGGFDGPDDYNDEFHDLDIWFTPGVVGGQEWYSNHLWFRKRAAWNHPTPQNMKSDEAWYVINGHNGEHYSISVSSILEEYSEAWFDSSQYYYVNCNEPEVSFTGNGYSTPVYYIERYDPVPYYMDDVFISAPANDHMFDLQEIDNTSVELLSVQYVFGLQSIFPNPAVFSATICYSLADSGVYELSIFDISGRKIEKLLDKQNRSAGNYSVAWDISENEIPAGVYYVQLEGEGQREVKSIVVFN